MFRRRANVSISGSPIVLEDNKVEPSGYDINSIPVVDKVYYGISAKNKATVSYKATQRVSGATYQLEAVEYTEIAIRKGLPFEKKIQRDLVILKVGGKYVGWGFIFDNETALFNAKSGAKYPQDFELPPSEQDIIDEYLQKGMTPPRSPEIRDILTNRQLGGTLNSKYLTPYFGGAPGYYKDSPEKTYVNVDAVATPIRVVKSSTSEKSEKSVLKEMEVDRKMSTAFSFKLDPLSYIIFEKPLGGEIHLETLLTGEVSPLVLESSSSNSLSVSSNGVIFYLNWKVSPLFPTYMTELKVYAIDTIKEEKSPVIDLKSGDEAGIDISELRQVSKLGTWFKKAVSKPGREKIKALKSKGSVNISGSPIIVSKVENELRRPSFDIFHIFENYLKNKFFYAPTTSGIVICYKVADKTPPSNSVFTLTKARQIASSDEFPDTIVGELYALKVEGKFVGFGFIYNDQYALIDMEGSFPQDIEVLTSEYDYAKQYALQNNISTPDALDIIGDNYPKTVKGSVENSSFLKKFFGSYLYFSPKPSTEPLSEISATAIPVKVQENTNSLEDTRKKLGMALKIEKSSNGNNIYLYSSKLKTSLQRLLGYELTPVSYQTSANEEIGITKNKFLITLKYDNNTKPLYVEAYAEDLIKKTKSPHVILQSKDGFGIYGDEISKLKAVGKWLTNKVDEYMSTPQEPIVQEPIVQEPKPKPIRKPVETILTKPIPKPIAQEPILTKPKPIRKPVEPKPMSPVDAFGESLYVLNADIDLSNINDNEIYSVIAELKSSTDSMPKTHDSDVWTDLLKLTLKELNRIYDLGDLSPSESQEVLSYLKPILDNIPMSFSKKAFLRYFR